MAYEILPAWDVQVNGPDTINAARGEPPLVVTIKAENWEQVKEAWAHLLAECGE
jgi:hypothetical protein